MKIKDPNDPTKEIEVYTKDDIDAARNTPNQSAIDAAVAAYKTANPDQSAAVEKLKTDLAIAQAELEAAEGLNGGEAGRAEQIQRLKTARDVAQTALTGQLGSVVAKVDQMEKNQLHTMKEAALDRAGITKKEDREKVLLAFEKYDPTNATPEGISERITAAVGISGVNVSEQPGAFDGVGGMGANRGTGNHTAPGTVTDNAKAIGANLGIKPEELQAHVDKKAGKTA